MIHIRPLLMLLFVWFLTGCNLSSTPPNDIPPTPTTLTTLRSTTVPTLARIYHTVEARPTLEPTSEIITTTPEPPCGLDANVATTRHTINAVVDYAQHTVNVDQTVTFINRTGAALNDLVLNIEPNRYPGAFTLSSLITSGDQTPAFDLTGRRLFVQLVEPVAVDCSVQLQLSYQIAVPLVGTGVEAYKGFFAYSERQLNLGHWMPTVALRAGDEWITRQAVFLGEQEVLTDADWDVTLKVEQASDTLIVAAPGDVEELGTNHWRYHLTNARDFTVSMSESFQLSTVESKDGITVELYTFSDSKVTLPSGSIVDGAQHALNVSVSSLETYNTLYGIYPYERLLVVQGDFPDGMEFSNIVFVSSTWFKNYTGDPAGYLTLITVHEVAHQWWYARVGNDPALAPWLDEALATYSEFVFIEEYYPTLKAWWWQFRVDDWSPGGYVDSTVYEFSSIRAYINAVYLRGVKMLDALRQDLGTEAFFDWLKRYAEAGTGEVVTPTFFWSLLSPEEFALTEQTRLSYLRIPGAGL